MNLKSILSIVAILGILFLLWWLLTRGRSKGKVFLTYQFFRQTDSPGGDLQFLQALAGNVDGLKEACNKTPGCIGFNTAGYLKNSIDPNKFKEYSGYPDWAGLYVKRKEIKS